MHSRATIRSAASTARYASPVCKGYSEGAGRPHAARLRQHVLERHYDDASWLRIWKVSIGQTSKGGADGGVPLRVCCRCQRCHENDATGPGTAQECLTITCRPLAVVRPLSLSLPFPCSPSFKADCYESFTIDVLTSVIKFSSFQLYAFNLQGDNDSDFPLGSYNTSRTSCSPSRSRLASGLGAQTHS